MDKQMAKAYLKRIGMEREAQMSREYLDSLIVAHLQSVPFENLDAADFHMVPDLEKEKIYQKIVEKKRGGWCFEQNLLFADLLAALGVEVYPIAVRVVWNRDFLPPLSHMALIAVWDGVKYYCDVGFGGPGPKGLLKLQETEQTVHGESFRVKEAQDGDLLIERMHHGEWKMVLRFTDRAVREVDLALLNFYCARCEKVLFSHTRVLNICTPKGSKALQGAELTIRRDGREEKVIYRSKRELEAGMEREFGICISLPKENS